MPRVQFKQSCDLYDHISKVNEAGIRHDGESASGLRTLCKASDFKPAVVFVKEWSTFMIEARKVRNVSRGKVSDSQTIIFGYSGLVHQRWHLPSAANPSP